MPAKKQYQINNIVNEQRFKPADENATIQILLQSDADADMPQMRVPHKSTKPCTQDCLTSEYRKGRKRKSAYLACPFAMHISSGNAISNAAATSEVAGIPYSYPGKKSAISSTQTIK